MKITSAMIMRQVQATNEKGVPLVKAPCGWIIRPNPSVVFSKPSKIKYIRSKLDKVKMSDKRKLRYANRSQEQINKDNKKRRDRYASLSEHVKAAHREKRRLAHKDKRIAKKAKRAKTAAHTIAAAESTERKKARAARREARRIAREAKKVTAKKAKSLAITKSALHLKSHSIMHKSPPKAAHIEKEKPTKARKSLRLAAPKGHLRVTRSGKSVVRRASS